MGQIRHAPYRLERLEDIEHQTITDKKRQWQVEIQSLSDTSEQCSDGQCAPIVRQYHLVLFPRQRLSRPWDQHLGRQGGF